MGTRGLTGLARMRVGSTVSALLKDRLAGEPADRPRGRP